MHSAGRDSLNALPVLAKLEHVPDEFAVVVPFAVVTGETELIEHPE
jgi:hypothetical protein